MSNLSFVASPKSAKVSINNLQRVCAGFGVNPVISHNDGMVLKMLGSAKQIGDIKMLKTTDGKFFTAEDMAAKLGISTSYVYAKLAKLEAHPARKEGKQAFYDQHTLDRMQGRVRRQRRVIPAVVEKFQQVSKEHLEIETKVQEQPVGNLLERMQNLEKKLERFEAIEKSIDEIKRILGTL